MISKDQINAIFNKCIRRNTCCVADNCRSFTELINRKVTCYTAEVIDHQPCYADGFVTEVAVTPSNEDLLPHINTTIGLLLPPHDDKGHWGLIWKDDTSPHPDPVNIEKVIFHR